MSKNRKTQSVWQRTFGKSIRKPANKLTAIVASKVSRGRVIDRKQTESEVMRQKNGPEDEQKNRESHLNELKASGRFYVCPLCRSVMLPKEPVLIRHFKSHRQKLSYDHAAVLLRKQMVDLGVQPAESAAGRSAD